MSEVKQKTAILLVVEKGYIEHQARLLVQSIQHFYDGPKDDLEVFTFSPRKDFKPNPATREFLAQFVTHHFDENLNTEFVEFPLINGHIGASFFEQHFPEYTQVMLLDTDTVFLQDFSFLLQHDKQSLLLSPVDNKGVGTLGETDENHDFWLRIYHALGIDEPTCRVTTTVGQEKIWPYYNAGFVCANNIPGFFTQWLNNFKTIYRSDIRSVFAGKHGSKSIYLEQVALALTAQQHRSSIIDLQQSINYPIPFHPRLKQRSGALALSDLVHVHYHRWFQHPGFLKHIATLDELSSEPLSWLADHLPLSPLINDPFKC